MAEKHGGRFNDSDLFHLDKFPPTATLTIPLLISLTSSTRRPLFSFFLISDLLFLPVNLSPTPPLPFHHRTTHSRWHTTHLQSP
ncbi:hypothetical protein CsSME_00014907 [Camellia sinensis var. sinensis]